MPPRKSLRKPLTLRVVELLTSNGMVWAVGLAVGLMIVVVMTVLDRFFGYLFAVPLVLAGAFVVFAKERVVFVRRRMLVTGDPMSRRQVLALVLSVTLVAIGTAALGDYAGRSMLRGYDEKIRRYLSRQAQKKSG